MANWSKKADDIIPCGRGRLRKLMPCRIWHFRHRAADGKWRYKSTGHHDRKGAICWAEAFSMRLTRAEFTGIPAEGRSVASRAAQAAVTPSIRRGLVSWLRYQKQQNEENTVRSYRTIGVKYARFLRLLGIRRFDQIDRAVMMKFREHCVSKLNNCKITVDNNLIALRSFFSWAISKGWLATNPASQSRHGERLFFDEAPCGRRPTAGPSTSEFWLPVMATPSASSPSWGAGACGSPSWRCWSGATSTTLEAGCTFATKVANDGPEVPPQR